MLKKLPVYVLFVFCLVTASPWVTIAAEPGPFPVKGQIYDGNDQLLGMAHVYPKYVEIFSLRNLQVGKVGILVEEGIAKLFLVGYDDNRTLVGYADKGQLFNQNDKAIGSYFVTPTWSFVYDLNGKRAGKVKCIAWPRVCAVGVGGYLLNLFGATHENTP
jgi:hypothetical protein